jgi:predicted permease
MRLKTLWTNLFCKQRADQDLDAELRSYTQILAEEKIAAGMSAAEAHRQARIELGGSEQVKEQVRDVRAGAWLDSFRQDLRYALRILGKFPGFAIAVVLLLALGIGVNTAVFSIVDNVLLRPLPFPQQGRMFVAWAKSEEQGSAKIGASGLDFQDYQDQSRSFDYLADVLPRFTYTWTGQGEPRNLWCTATSADFFPMLGVRPLLGRLYAPEEYHIDGVQVVLAQRFWKEQLGGDPHVLGRVLVLGGEPATVIGVMPDMPDLYPDTDIWAKLVPDFAWMRLRSNKLMTVVGRLKPGVTPRQAEQELTSILRRAPAASQQLSVQLVPLRDELVGAVRTQLDIVMAAVALVLLVSCVNAAFLLLARAAKRQPEIALRLSLGASRGRLLRQFITENLVLALFGGALGVLLALNIVHLLKRLNLENLPRAQMTGIDVGVLLFALSMTLLASVVLAWAPSATFSRLDLNSALKSKRAEVGASGRCRFQLLLISEVSLTIVLLVAAGLLVRSFRQAERINAGFQPDHLLLAYLRTDFHGADGGVFFSEALDRIARMSGVRAAALAKCVPGEWTPQAAFTFDDRPRDPYNTPEGAACWVSPEFFRTIATPLLQGRQFDAHDVAQAPPVAIVNAALAHLYWPGQNPIGKRIAVNFSGSARLNESAIRFREVVGVVADLRQQSLDQPIEPTVYTAFLQDETYRVFAGLNLFVRTENDPLLSTATVRAQIHDVRPDQPVDLMQTMDGVLMDSLAPRRFSFLLVGSFAALALLISAIGIYGMVAYSVNVRTAEFGLRMALGAQRQEVLRLVLGESLRTAAVGVAAGVIASLIFSRFMSSLLFGITASDPLTFVGVAALLGLVALAACYVPARRATRVDPMMALRHE